MRRAAGAAVVVAALVVTLTGCSQQEAALSPEAQRGRQAYQAHCVACHNADPALNGPVGPAVRGTSVELLRAKVIEGAYPPGYAPKRPTKVMQPMPHLAQEVPALAAYLR